MIIFSQSKLEINKIYGSNSIENHKLHADGKVESDARFMVLREATREEYLEAYKEKYGGYPTNDPWYDNFYLISVD